MISTQVQPLITELRHLLALLDSESLRNSQNVQELFSLSSEERLELEQLSKECIPKLKKLLKS
jgi:hypothetical protein